MAEGEQAGEAARRRDVEFAEAASAQRDELRELTAAMAAQQSQLARLEMQTQQGQRLPPRPTFDSNTAAAPSKRSVALSGNVRSDFTSVLAALSAPASASAAVSASGTKAAAAPHYETTPSSARRSRPRLAISSAN